MGKFIKFILTRTLISVTILILSANVSFAGSGDAGQPGEFLRWGVGARALGMGKAFSSIADDGSAVYWNPAGVAQLRRNELMFMHVNLFAENTYFDYIGYNANIDTASVLSFLRKAHFDYWGLGCVVLTVGAFEGRDKYNNPTSTFSNVESSVIANLSGDIINHRLIANYGVNLKIVNQNSYHGKVNDFGFGFDIGTIIQPINLIKWRFWGIKYQMPLRLGAKLSYLTGDYAEPIDPLSYHLGLSYSLRFGNFYILPSLDYEGFLNANRSEFSVGSEFSCNYQNNIISLRVGLPWTNEEKFNFGVGYSRKAFDLNLSFTGHENSGLNSLSSSPVSNPNLVRLSLSWKFGDARDAGKAKGIISEFEEKIEEIRKNESKLLRYFSQYPFDINYEKKGYYNNIAKKFINDKFKPERETAKAQKDLTTVRKYEGIIKRYGDFIGGLAIIDEDFDEALKKYKGLRSSCGENRDNFEDLRDRYEEEKDELVKQENSESFKRYLQALLIIGENQKVVRIVTGKDDTIATNPELSTVDSTLFLAFATKELDSTLSAALFDSVIIKESRAYSHKPCVRLLARLSKAVVTDGDTIALRDMVDPKSGEDWEYSYKSNIDKEEYYPFPLICDGILADDAMFVEACFRSRNINNSEEIIKLFIPFIPIVLELPQTDLGNVAADKLSELYANRSNLAEVKNIVNAIWQEYRDTFVKNSVISSKIFERGE